MTVVDRPSLTAPEAGKPAGRAGLRGPARSRIGVLGEIADRRLLDVRAELAGRTFRELAAAADAASAAPGGAPRPLAPRLAAPGLHLFAEVKRQSPSAGVLAAGLDAVAQARAYQAGGAAAISVLCEPHRFGGSIADLRAVRAAVSIPVLAKEFVVDERQLPVLRSAGADVVLLIAALHPARRLASLVTRARDLGLEPLVEAHDERELEAAMETKARLIGINARDLRTLAVDVARLHRLHAQVPGDRLTVAESGVRDAGEVARLRATGYDAVLVGEALVRSANPAATVRAFVAAGAPPDDATARDRAPFIKICGVTDLEGVFAAVRAGADAIGLNLVPGTPRALTLDEAARFALLARGTAGAGNRPMVVAVFADASADEIAAGVAACNPDAIQLSGHESPDAIAGLARPAWKVLHLPADAGRTRAPSPRPPCPRLPKGVDSWPRAPNDSCSTPRAGRIRAARARVPTARWPRPSPASCRWSSRVA